MFTRARAVDQPNREGDRLATGARAADHGPRRASVLHRRPLEFRAIPTAERSRRPTNRRARLTGLSRPRASDASTARRSWRAPASSLGHARRSSAFTHERRRTRASPPNAPSSGGSSCLVESLRHAELGWPGVRQHWLALLLRISIRHQRRDDWHSPALVRFEGARRIQSPNRTPRLTSPPKP